MTGRLLSLARTTTLPGPEVSEVVFIIDAEGLILFATPVAAHLYGYEPEDIVGQSALHFIAPEEYESVQARWAQLLNNPDVLVDEMTVEVINAGGQRSRVRMSAWRLPGRDEFLLLHHVFDHLRDRLDTLYSILNAFSGILDLRYVLDVVLHEVHRLIDCATSTIFMIEPGGKTILARRWHNNRFEEERTSADAHTPEFETSRIIRQTGQPLIINNTATDPRWTTIPDQRLIGSWLGAPLLHRGEFFGELTLDDTRQNAFSPADAELAMALATQVAAAIYSARQYEKAQRRAKRFQALSEVSQAISHLDLDSVLEVVYHKISELMDASVFFIALLDEDTGQVRLVGAYEHGQRQPDAIQAAGAGMIGHVVQTRESVIRLDTSTEGFPEGTIIEDKPPQSLMMVPLITREQVVGVISVQSYQAQAYTADDAALFRIVAGAVATAVRNAQFYDQTAARLDVLETLHQTSLQLSSVQDPDAVARLTLAAVLELFQLAQVRLLVSTDFPWDARLWLGHASGKIDPPADANPPHSNRLLEYVHQTGQELIISDLSNQPDLQTEFQLPWLVHALIAYPIQRGDRRFGALMLLYGEPQVFGRDLLRTLELLCMQAATALENAFQTITLRRRLDEVTALQDLARRISASQSLDDILHTVVQTLRDVYQCQASSLALLDPAEQTVSLRVAAGIDQSRLQSGELSLGEVVAGQVVATGRVIYVPDTLEDERFQQDTSGTRSLMAVPLTVQDRVIGALSIESAQPNAFTPNHERVLIITGSQIAATIESVRHAHALAAANAQLEAQDKLRRELLIQVSHDLRSPLTLVQGYAGLLADQAFGPISPEQVEYLNIIEQRAQSIQRLTEDILSTRPIDTSLLELAPLDITQLSEQAIADARIVFASSNMAFTTDLAPGEFVVEGDEARLNRVYYNLISNAVKFSPEGGVITLSTRHDAEGGRILVSITDQGIGIQPDKLPHIFERFFRGDKEFRSRFDGSGVGLYNVKQIVEAHHGAVWGESEVGVGSTLTFALPLAVQPTGER